MGGRRDEAVRTTLALLSRSDERPDAVLATLARMTAPPPATNPRG